LPENDIIFNMEIEKTLDNVESYGFDIRTALSGLVKICEKNTGPEKRLHDSLISVFSNTSAVQHLWAMTRLSGLPFPEDTGNTLSSVEGIGEFLKFENAIWWRTADDGCLSIVKIEQNGTVTLPNGIELDLNKAYFSGPDRNMKMLHFLDGVPPSSDFEAKRLVLKYREFLTSIGIRNVRYEKSVTLTSTTLNISSFCEIMDRICDFCKAEQPGKLPVPPDFTYSMEKSGQMVVNV